MPSSEDWRVGQQVEVLSKLRSGRFGLQIQALRELKGLRLTPQEARQSGIGAEVCRLQYNCSVMSEGKASVKQLLAGWLCEVTAEGALHQRFDEGGGRRRPRSARSEGVGAGNRLSRSDIDGGYMVPTLPLDVGSSSSSGFLEEGSSQDGSDPSLLDVQGCRKRRKYWEDGVVEA